MILLYNVKITDHRKSPVSRCRKYDWSKYEKRLNIFKFSLDSMSHAKLLFDKIIINVHLDDDYKNERNKLEIYINNLFSGKDTHINFYRCTYRNDWDRFFEKYDIHDEDLIFFMGNDDHVLFDSDLNFLSSIKNILKKDNDLMSIFLYSHFPENIRICTLNDMNLIENKFVCNQNSSNHNFSFHIFKAYRLKKALFEINYPKDFLVFRLDELSGHISEQKYSDFLGNVYTPLKEVIRHYDGYGHEMYSNNYNPPLEIPYGFFENDIKIKYGYKRRYENYLNFNPSAPLLYTCNINSPDHRFYISENNLLNDVPLVYKNKISSIDHNENLDYNYLKEKRNYYYLKSSKQKVNYIDNEIFVPDTWIKYNFI